MATVVLLSGCGASEAANTTDDSAHRSGDLDRLDGYFGFDLPVLGEDRWEVTLCQVPATIDNATFDATDERLAVTPAQIVTAIEPVAGYFERWSRGLYEMTLVPGAVVAIEDDDEAQACVEAAIAVSSQESSGVIVVADALHRGDVPGGWAQPGVGCATTPCAARDSRRAVYVGAADFFSLMDIGQGDATDSVPLDLLEHEIGHTFGWPHSSRSPDFRFADTATRREYDNVIDIMSNSAAPRAVDSRRRHGPGVLAFNLLSARWLAPGDVAIADATSLVAQSFALSTADVGRRDRREHPVVVVLELDDTTAVTIELVTDHGDNDHLARSGLAVHVVEWGSEVCPVPRAAGYCLGVDRRVTLVGESADGLIGVGQSVSVGEFMVALTALPGSGSVAEVAIWRR